MKHIPNFITCLNLTSGFIAAVFASNGDLVTASWLILAAMIFDFLDGFSARLLKAFSETGKELDSLADIVSFGVAPAIILFKLIHSSLYTPDPLLSGAVIMAVLTYVPSLMPVCAAIRLAKFNTDPAQKTSFRGLPTPANAIGVISIVIAAHYSGMSLIISFIANPALLIIYTIILSLLMVTRIPLLSLKISSAAFKGNEGRYILAGLVLASFLLFGIGAAPLIVPLYLLASFLSSLLRPAVSAG